MYYTLRERVEGGAMSWEGELCITFYLLFAIQLPNIKLKNIVTNALNVYFIKYMLCVYLKLCFIWLK